MNSEELKENEEKRLTENYTFIQDDPHPGVHGVLLASEIDFYSTNYHMIDPYHPNHLKQAAYELTIGDEYIIENKKQDIHLTDDKIIMKPFQVVIIKTAETLNLPSFIIARWNIRVRQAYKGLLWVGGPQVDPGWVGHLFCPIYNLSEDDVTLEFGERIAVIDFVKTTPYVESTEKKIIDDYSRPPSRTTLDSYREIDLMKRGALYAQITASIGEMRKKIDETKHDVDGLRSSTEHNMDRISTRVDIFAGSVITILAVIITALTILVSLSKNNNTLPWWIWVFGGLSVFSFIFAILGFLSRKKG